MPGQAGGRTFLDRSRAADDFPPLSADQEADAHERRAQQIGSPEWKARVDAKDRADKAAYASDATSTGDGASPGAGRRRSASTLASAGSGAASSAGSGMLAMVRGKRPATLSSAMLGMVAYALTINFIEGGWPQVKGWFGAKFFNAPYAPTPATTTATATSTSATKAAATVYTFPTGAVVAPKVQGAVT